ncbi:phage tail tape measure protein [Paraliobacillus sp. X-1268]|uniref:phage tail tape measure protein n=1 Tax=Paraliobacillus sp. X-1268 TaxID=2213193 RepID=UPI000E3E547A|nr:phage tail tape measure protein [Paraliobacillus sp. X-1268]
MAERIEGLSIELDLETMKINSGLKDLKSQLTTVNSEMKANMSAFDRSDKSIGKYETRLQGLNKKLEVQQAVTEKAFTSYEKMVKEHGEGSIEAQKAAKEYNNQVASLNNLSRYVGRVEDDLSKLREEQRVANSNWTKMGNKLDNAGNKMQAFGNKATGVGNAMSTTLTPAVLGMGTAMGLVASSYEDSTVRIQNSLGLTAEETKKLTNISRNIYKDGFGESIDEVDTALLQTRQNIKDLNDAELENITTKAIILADTFDADVNEVTRAGNNLMKGFGLEADEAFDLMAKGAQNGLNFSNEMFDNLSEYSTLFGNMGYSAEEYFELLQKGTEAGVYNLDYINDIMKEFQIRVKDGSKTTSEAMGLLSKDTQGVWEEFEKGDKTVKDVSNAVLKELEGMDDQVAANQIGVELFGTKFEDLEADAVYSLGGIGEGIEDVDGTMDDMTKNAEQSISKQWKATWREAKEVLLPVGETLLDFTQDVLPDVKDGIEDVTEWFEELDEEGKKNIIMLGGIAAAAGPVLSVVGGLSSGVGGLIKVTGSLTKTVGLSGKKGLTGALSLLSKGGVAGLAIAGVAGLSIGLYNLTQRNKETEEATLEVAQSLNDQAVELESSAETFNRLSEKAKISNDELARMNDLNIRIAESSNPGEIKELQEQYNNLAEKSGLSKDELNKLFEANENIIDQTPDVETNVSKQGNAFAKNTEAVNEYISSLYEATRIELEGERENNLIKEKETREEINKLNKDHEEYQKRITRLVEAQQMSEEARGERIREIANEIDTEILSTEEHNRLTNEKNDLLDIQDGKYGKIFDSLTKGAKETREKLENEEESLEKIQAFDAEYQNIILKQVDINEEGQKGLDQLDKAIEKNSEEILQLEEKRQKNGELTQEEQERLNYLIASNEEQQEAKLYISEELGLYNDINSLLDTKLTKLSEEEQQKINNLAKTTEIKVEEGNIVGQIQKKNEKLLETKNKLVENLEKEGANKDEINKQIAAIDTKLGRNDTVIEKILREAGLWDQVKDEINAGREALETQGAQIDNNNTKTDIGITKEQERTKEAGKDVDKNILLGDIDDRVNGVNSLLKEKINKNVSLNTSPRISDLNSELSSSISKTLTISQRFEDVTSGNLWAKGTPPQGHPGGHAVLGDGVGSNSGSELVTLPGGKMFFSASKPTLYPNLPKGTHVMPARKTKTLFKSINHYADGTSGWESALDPINLRTEFTKLLALLGRQSNSSGQTNRPTKTAVDYTKDLLNATLQQNEILMQLLAKDINPIIDSRSLGKGLEPVITETQNRKQKVREKFGV